MYISYSSPCEANLRSFIEHVKLVNDANLEFPIILNEDGFVIDGRHRLSKAIIEGKKTIKSKRFISDPEACFEWV
jgi:disulfide oxidoreductase YuzD